MKVAIIEAILVGTVLGACDHVPTAGPSCWYSCETEIIDCQCDKSKSWDACTEFALARCKEDGEQQTVFIHEFVEPGCPEFTPKWCE